MRGTCCCSVLQPSYIELLFILFFYLLSFYYLLLYMYRGSLPELGKHRVNLAK